MPQAGRHIKLTITPVNETAVLPLRERAVGDGVARAEEAAGTLTTP